MIAPSYKRIYIYIYLRLKKIDEPPTFIFFSVSLYLFLLAHLLYNRTWHELAYRENSSAKLDTFSLIFSERSTTDPWRREFLSAGNYWILHIMWPSYTFLLHTPNDHCHKTLYMFSLVHLGVMYITFGVMLLVVTVLASFRILACPLSER